MSSDLFREWVRLSGSQKAPRQKLGACILIPPEHILLGVGLAFCLKRPLDAGGRFVLRNILK